MKTKCPVCGSMLKKLPVTFEAVERTQYGCVINMETEEIVYPTIKDTSFFVENVNYRCFTCDSPLHLFADKDLNNIIAQIAIRITKREE